MPEWYTHPHWVLAILFVVVGFWLLIKGADLLVEGGVGIARRYRLSVAVIGATVVAFGTSLPELVVSFGSNIKATLDPPAPGAPDPKDLVIGNVVGSNIFNIGAILGVGALMMPLRVAPSTLRLDYPLMLLVFAGFTCFALVSVIGDWYGIDRVEGAVFLAGLFAFTWMAVRMGRQKPEALPVSEVGSLRKAWMAIGGGILLLTVGGDVTLNGAIQIAHELGMSMRVIGLTVIAVGTSLPELMTSIQGLRKGHAELAVANVVGSNLFNVLCILGLCSVVFPLPVEDAAMAWDFPWMLGFAVVLLPFLLRGRIGRAGGAFLLTATAVFVVLTMVYDDPAAAIVATTEGGDGE